MVVGGHTRWRLLLCEVCKESCRSFNQRWGMMAADLDTKAIVGKVNREDLWRQAAKNIGVAAADIPAGTSRGKETFFDKKVFDPADPKAYLASLGIKKVA